MSTLSSSTPRQGLNPYWSLLSESSDNLIHEIMQMAAFSSLLICAVLSGICLKEREGGRLLISEKDRSIVEKEQLFDSHCWRAAGAQHTTGFPVEGTGQSLQRLWSASTNCEKEHTALFQENRTPQIFFGFHKDSALHKIILRPMVGAVLLLCHMQSYQIGISNNSKYC